MPSSGASLALGPTAGTARLTGLAIAGAAVQRGGLGCADGDGIRWSVQFGGASARGAVMQVGVAAGTTGTLGLLLFSLDNDDLGGLPLPLDATPAGAPGYVLEVGNDFGFPVASGASVSLAVPDSPVFPGVVLFSQAVLADFGAAPNALGLVATDFLRIVLTQ